MIFHNWRDFSSFILTQTLLYLFIIELLSSLAEISIHFINYLIDFESRVVPLKRLCFLCFLNLNLFEVLAKCFTTEVVTQQRHSAVASLPLFCLGTVYSSADSFAVSFAGPQPKGGSFGFLRCLK